MNKSLVISVSADAVRTFFDASAAAQTNAVIVLDVALVWRSRCLREVIRHP